MKVTLRAATRRRQRGVRVFYVDSFTRPDREYTVQYVRRPGQRRWACACQNYFHVQSVRRRHCKHILLVRRWVTEAGGLRKARAGQHVAVAVDPVQPVLTFTEVL